MISNGLRGQPEGWADFDTCVPPLDAAAVVVEIGYGAGQVTYEACRLSCASDASCYCYVVVDGVCYSGLSRCACEAARGSGCAEVGERGFVVHKDMVRCCVGLAFLSCGRHLRSALCGGLAGCSCLACCSLRDGLSSRRCCRLCRRLRSEWGHRRMPSAVGRARRMGNATATRLWKAFATAVCRGASARRARMRAAASTPWTTGSLLTRMW